MATRRELAHINRENEKQQRELEELKVILEVSTGNFYVKDNNRYQTFDKSGVL